MIKSNAQTMDDALTKFPNEEGLILSPRAPDEWACKYCCYSLKWKSRMSLMRLHINSLTHKRKKVELAENLTKDPNSLTFIHRGKGEGNGPKRKRERKKKIEKIPLFKERVRVGGTRVKIERDIKKEEYINKEEYTDSPEIKEENQSPSYQTESNPMQTENDESSSHVIDFNNIIKNPIAHHQEIPKSFRPLPQENLTQILWSSLQYIQTLSLSYEEMKKNWEVTNSKLARLQQRFDERFEEENQKRSVTKVWNSNSYLQQEQIMRSVRGQNDDYYNYNNN